MTNHPHIRSYATGFAVCLLLTAAAFGMTSEHLATGHQLPSHAALLVGILGLAFVQLFAQLYYFLHVGPQSKARDMATLALAATIVVVLVGGSLWIMANLGHQEAVPFYNASITPQASTD